MHLRHGTLTLCGESSSFAATARHTALFQEDQRPHPPLSRSMKTLEGKRADASAMRISMPVFDPLSSWRFRCGSSEGLGAQVYK